MARKKAPAAKVVAEAQPKQVIYVGPSFRDSRFKTYMVFRDGVPEDATDAEKKLFVPISKLEEVRKALTQKGSAMRIFFEDVVKEHDKGGK